MLSEYREHCRLAANSLPGWEKLSKNDLCRLYIKEESNPEITNACFSALLYKYWGLIPKYFNQSSNVASPEDCYEWLVASITYALKHRKWEDPTSTIYNDPNGPDKVINRYMKCARLTFYQFINRQKRKDDFSTISLDMLTESLNDNTFDIEDESKRLDTSSKLDFKDYIKDVFNRKDYFLAFMLDSMLYEPIFDGKDINNPISKSFNVKKLAKYLRQLDTTYCQIFSKRYKIPLETVLNSVKYCNHLSSTKIYSKIEYNLNKLRHDDFFIHQWEG